MFEKCFENSSWNINRYPMDFLFRKYPCRGTLQIVRYAGGGGRPGKARTLNWKQKRILGLDKPQAKSFKDVVRPTGDFSDIAGFFDEKSGDRMIDITDLENFESPKIKEEVMNDKKKVRLNMLFGSNKPFGALTVPKREKFVFRFSGAAKNSG